MENLKKSGENKNKLRTIYPRNQENLRTASIESNITGSYKKESIGERCKKWGDLKLVSAIFYQIFIFALNDRPSKTMKNVFYLM